MTRKNWAFRQAFFGTVEKSAFYLYVEKIWGEFLEGRTFLCPFWTTSKKCSVVKTVFNVSRGIFFWSFFWEKVYIYLWFSFSEQNFSVFSWNKSSRNAKTEFDMSTGNLGRKLLFFEKIVGILTVFTSERKTFGPLAKTFRQGCENCLRHVHGIILKRFFWEKIR